MSHLDAVFQANMEIFDRYYDKPAWWFRLRYDTQVKRKTVLHLIRKVGRSTSNQRVLEIGYGSGAVLFSFDISCEICGIEVSASALRRAKEIATKKGYKDFSFMNSQHSLPVKSEYMDVVIASHVLEHVENDVTLLKEIRRVLKLDGIAIILVPINEKYEDPKHVRHYSTSSLIRLVSDSGFEVVEQLENELLFHMVETFYHQKYNKKWKVFGPIIVALFNLPTSLLPFSAYRLLEFLLLRLGYLPRQVGIVLKKAP